MGALLFQNENVVPQLSGMVVRTGTSPGNVLLAQADSAPHTAQIIGARISDVASGASGLVATVSACLNVRMEAEPTVNGKVYLSETNPGLGATATGSLSFVLGACINKVNIGGVWFALVLKEASTSSSPSGGDISLTAKGDLITFDGTNVVRLPVGSNGQVLTAESTAESGLLWQTPQTELVLAGSIFSITGPLGAPNAVAAYDFTRYDPALATNFNLYGSNISTDPMENIMTPVGSPTYGYKSLLAGGFNRSPALASVQGGCFQDDAGTNSTGSLGNSAYTTPTNNNLRIVGALTIEALFAISAMSLNNGDNWSVCICCGEGEGEEANILYSIGVTVASGPVITVGYTAERNAGINITAPLAVIQSPVGQGPMFWTFTRDATGRVSFYINGQRVTSLITPTDAGGGGIYLPTRGASPAQMFQLSRAGSVGTNLKQWQAVKITAACFTDNQVNESYRRSMFGVGSSLP